MSKHQLSTDFINFRPHGCVHCWKCIDACPKQVIGKVKFLWHTHVAIVKPEACIGCGKCVAACLKSRFQKKPL